MSKKELLHEMLLLSQSVPYDKINEELLNLWKSVNKIIHKPETKQIKEI